MSTNELIRLTLPAIAGTGAQQGSQQGRACNDWGRYCDAGHWATSVGCTRGIRKDKIPRCEQPTVPTEQGRLKKLAVTTTATGQEVLSYTVIQPVENTYLYSHLETYGADPKPNRYLRVYKLADILCDHRDASLFSPATRVAIQDQATSNVLLLYQTYVGAAEARVRTR